MSRLPAEPAARAGAPLAGLRVSVAGADPAAGHGAWLLGCLGAHVGVENRGVAGLRAPGHQVAATDAGSPAADWAASGAMWLTGTAAGPPLLPPGTGASAARGALLAFELLSSIAGHAVRLPGHRLLGERAAATGRRRRGPWSPGGAFRLVRTSDALMGLSLARLDDLDLVRALVETVDIGDPWSAVTEWAGARPAAEAVDRARLLGLPACVLATPRAAAADDAASARGQVYPLRPYVVDGSVLGPPEPPTATSVFWPRAQGPRLVVDLSSLWAGPLCAHLLRHAGARVLKVESCGRPDGARRGPPDFYRLLHAGHECVALDFASSRDRARLIGLLDAADVVIESSRPRAMAQLGIDPTAIVAAGPDRTWLSITAYGRTGPGADRAGLGDDTAVAAGLVAFDPTTGTTVPCGDAIADPLAGAHAAVAALASALSGGSRVIDVALRDVVGATLADVTGPLGASVAAVRRRGRWELALPDGPVEVEPPRIRRAEGEARPVGADTTSVLTELGLA